MNSKINVAIIGKNFGYKVIFKVINKVKSFNVIAFCFKNKSNINFDKNIKIYDNWKKLLKNRKINAVIITSPPKTHFNIIKESIKRNIHIFCEKPVTISLSQISQIYKLIKKKKNIGYFLFYLQIIFIYYIMNSFKLKSLLMNLNLVLKIYSLLPQPFL